ncbi:MAG: hypothetical protein JJT75_10570 [Opitutales bacterium]|nr:hypothetical protein [Opitutales bacterium]MCH8541042.1 hypothetical protein [Opitutales bacterium]
MDQSSAPFLWLTHDRLQRLRRNAASPGPVSSLVKLARERVEAYLSAGNFPDEEESHSGAKQLLEAFCLIYVLEKDQKIGEAAGLISEGLLAQDIKADLGRADRAVHLAMAYNWCGESWSVERRQKIGEGLLQAALQVQPENSDCGGNPDNPFNNWWAVTHGGAGVAALAIRDEFPEAGEILEKSLERIEAYLLQLGDEGISYEGIGYGLYALYGCGPLVWAAETALRKDLTRWGGGLKNAARFVAGLLVPRYRPQEISGVSQPGGFGSRPSWNDDGAAPPSGRQLALLQYFAAKETRFDFANLLASYQPKNNFGAKGDKAGVAFLALSWSETLEDREPLPAEEVVPRVLVDKRLGYGVFRNGFVGAEDCVLGVYAKCYHPGGHCHEDAGSFRLMGLDGGWSQCGGQNKTAPVYQSVVLKNGRQRPEGGKFGGKEGRISYLRAEPDGSAMINMRLNQVYQSPIADRHLAVDYSEKAGVPMVVALVDQMLDKEECEWTWTLCFENDLEYEPWPEANGFLLRQPRNGATCAWRFAAPLDLSFELVQGEPTKRNFAGGMVKHYVASRYVQTKVSGKGADFFAYATVQHGTPPEAVQEGSGLQSRIRIGGAEIFFQHGKWYHGPVRIQKNQSTD